MKKLMILSVLIMSAQAFAQVINTNWQYNRSVCRAQTVCPNGTTIYCQTVGFNYGNAPAVINNMCRTRVVPGVGIHCQGFADKRNAFGRIIFVPANIPVSCY